MALKTGSFAITIPSPIRTQLAGLAGTALVGGSIGLTIPAVSTQSTQTGALVSGTIGLTIPAITVAAIDGPYVAVILPSTTIALSGVVATSSGATVTGTIAITLEVPEPALSGADSPLPVITQLYPASAIQGSTVTLSILGLNFESTSVVYFGATALTTTYFSSTSLNAALPSSLVTAPGVVEVQVKNPADPSVSNLFPFIIFGPPPESPHPYLFDNGLSVTYTYPGSPANIWIQFDLQTYVYRDPDPTNNDTITITAPGGFSQIYQGSDLAGLTVQIPNATFTVAITVVSGGNFYGFRVLPNVRTTAPPKFGYYLLGNRNSEDQPYSYLKRLDTPVSSFGPFAATHDPYGNPQILPEVAVNQTYSYQFRFPNATGSVSWVITNMSQVLQPGIALDPVTGILSGTAPATPSYSVFQVIATDTAGNTARGWFMLRVFLNPVEIYAANNGEQNAVQINDFLWAFYEGEVLYAVFWDGSGGNTIFPLVYSSSDRGLTWVLVNTSDSHTATAKTIDKYRVGSTVYFAFWNGTLGFSSTVAATVVSYDLLTNTYTSIYTSGSYTGFTTTTFVTDLFVKPDSSIVQFISAVSGSPSSFVQQIWMITANGSASTLISDNALNIPSPNGQSCTLQTVLMDASGAFHVFWRMTVPLPGFAFDYRYFYRRVSPGLSLGDIQLLDQNYFFYNPSLFDETDFGHGYIKSDQTGIVIPFCSPSLFAGDPFGRNRIMHVMRGAPLSNPVWTFEGIVPSGGDTPGGVPDLSINDYFNPFGVGTFLIEDVRGESVTEYLFFAGFDQYDSDMDYGATWMVKNSGSGWSYRDRYNFEPAVPPYPPPPGNDQESYYPCVVLDPASPNGFLFFFIAFPGDPGGGVSERASFMVLHYPPPLPVPPPVLLGLSVEYIPSGVYANTDVITYTADNHKSKRNVYLKQPLMLPGSPVGNQFY
jgi:hypothetical protein